MSQISYDNNAKLYLIPTPIGNMDDITIRAIKTLEKVEVIFSEDTRVTGQLLEYLNIKNKKLISSHNFNEEKNKDKLLKYLNNGVDVGVVSDRGTPVISDPGYILARIAMDNGYNVIALPGPTALISALIVSGISPNTFCFYGFLSSKSSHQIKELENLKMYKHTLIFYESPHRILETLNNIKKVFGNRYISISREISKKHEEIYRGNIDEVLTQLNNPKGEFVIVVEGSKEQINYDLLTIVEHVNMYIKEGNSVMDSIKKVAKARNIPKNDVYKEYHNL
ncbi:MAG: 16S rRNA (cytidine(1402)-2'-O)-methyltransferase [Bacilli bacterium]|nr:16S rRNA (cytidine(1402)-2'-O)-methyltransferase [Bacilli bacterium]